MCVGGKALGRAADERGIQTAKALKVQGWRKVLRDAPTSLILLLPGVWDTKLGYQH